MFYIQNQCHYKFRPIPLLMHKSINSRVGADAQQFYSDDTLKMYSTYKSFMGGIDRVSTYTPISALLCSAPWWRQSDPFLWDGMTNFHLHQGHILTTSLSWQCALTALTQMDLDEHRHIFYVVWCSLRSGCRLLIKVQHVKIFSLFCFYPWQQDEWVCCSCKSTLGTLLFWNVCYQRWERISLYSLLKCQKRSEQRRTMYIQNALKTCQYPQWAIRKSARQVKEEEEMQTKKR